LGRILVQNRRNK
jgi:transposase-like protein